MTYKTDANDGEPRRTDTTSRIPSSGPFPPLTGEDCPNLYPGVDYMGCFKLGDDQVGWTDDDFEPTGSESYFSSPHCLPVDFRRTFR